MEVRVQEWKSAWVLGINICACVCVCCPAVCILFWGWLMPDQEHGHHERKPHSMRSPSRSKRPLSESLCPIIAALDSVGQNVGLAKTWCRRFKSHSQMSHSPSDAAVKVPPEEPETLPQNLSVVKVSQHILLHREFLMSSSSLFCSCSLWLHCFTLLIFRFYNKPYITINFL